MEPRHHVSRGLLGLLWGIALMPFWDVAVLLALQVRLLYLGEVNSPRRGLWLERLAVENLGDGERFFSNDRLGRLDRDLLVRSTDQVVRGSFSEPDQQLHSRLVERPRQGFSGPAKLPPKNYL